MQSTENCTIWGCQPTFAFSGNLIVPSAPSVQAGQTVFLFIGMDISLRTT